jgi:hypothetical protein
MKNQNQNHNWSTNDFNNTLDTVLRLSNTDEKEVNAILSAEIGCTTGAVKAAIVSFSRIAAGFEPSKKGTKGNNYGPKIKAAFDAWFSNQSRFTMRQLSHKF